MKTRKSVSGLTQAAKLLGAKGGKSGGPARARVLSHAQKVKIAAEGGRAKARAKNT